MTFSRTDTQRKVNIAGLEGHPFRDRVSPYSGLDNLLNALFGDLRDFMELLGPGRCRFSPKGIAMITSPFSASNRI